MFADSLLNYHFVSSLHSSKLKCQCAALVLACCIVMLYCLVSRSKRYGDTCRLAIVGGGYIAAEQACIYRNFGADVHMFFRGAHILGGQPSALTVCLSLFHAVAQMLLWLCPCKPQILPLPL